MRPELTLISFALIGVLLLASLAGFILHVRVRDAAAIAVIDNLNARIKSWWGIVLVMGGAVFAGRTAVIALFALISFLALREFLTLTAVQAADRKALLAAFLVALPAQYGFVLAARFDMFAVFIPAICFLALPVLTALSGDTRNFLARTAELVWGLAVCVYGISHVPALMMLPNPRNMLLVVYLIVVSQTSDVMQYVWGKLLGRHRVTPQLSPSKTVEGLIGGALSATALGAGLWWLTPFTVPQAAVMALVIALVGFLGGLVMSAIKRDRGVKNWSELIPGHGGILDRIDALCFAAPLFFYLTRWFVTG